MIEFSVRDRSEFGKEVVGYNMWDSDVLVSPSVGVIHQIPPKIEQSHLSKILDKLKIMDYNIS